MRRWFAVAAVLAFVLVCGAESCSGVELSMDDYPRLSRLRILQEDYPRVFFFRQSEGYAAQPAISYEKWENTFEKLMGIEGKVLDEEVIGREKRNIDFFTRFKKSSPEQLVLLHFNGNARDPRWRAERFFDGHWIYYNGARITADVSAQEGVSEIAVSNPNLFRVGIGRYRDKNEDIGLCELDEYGKPNWHRAEQVQLISVDTAKKTIRVRRACYGSRPRSFEAGKAYAAAHMSEGPWGKRNNLMWYYNYSTASPTDSNGRRCAEVLADHLAGLFDEGAELAVFDGVEFDVLKHECGGSRRGRGPDCDADGEPDGGYINGVNTYGNGVIDFCRALRERLGDDRIIQADGMSSRNQRAFGILNGIESEGWPHLSDWAISDWSGGLNRHFFWDRNGREPVFNYINHKYKTNGARPGERVNPEVPFSTHRLVFAAGMFVNAAFCYSLPPKSDPGKLIGIWDEFRMGTADRIGWLGGPVGPAVRMAAKTPDLLEAEGRPVNPGLVARFNPRAFREADAFRIEGKRGLARIRFRLSDVPCKGPDLVVLLTARGQCRQNCRPEAARLMKVAAVSEGRPVGRSDGVMAFINDKSFESSYYFCNLEADKIDLEFTVEGIEPVWIEQIAVYAHPDAMYREFENGIVLANPSPRPYTFDLTELFQRRRFRRLQGSQRQDPVVNNGSVVGNRVKLGGKDGLFLIESK